VSRGSVLDPFKPRVTRLLDTYPYSAEQIFQRLREEGYGGGITILRDYVRRIRPPKRPVYLKLHFAAGECAQVDWDRSAALWWAIPVAGCRLRVPTNAGAPATSMRARRQAVDLWTARRSPAHNSTGATQQQDSL
jgi:hypothetical protein